MKLSSEKKIGELYVSLEQHTELLRAIFTMIGDGKRGHEAHIKFLYLSPRDRNYINYSSTNIVRHDDMFLRSEQIDEYCYKLSPIEKKFCFINLFGDEE